MSVINSGVIVTSGNRAHAIAADSQGGTAVGAKYGDAGDVSVENSGDLLTTGNAAYAITALSEGAVAGAVTIHNTGDVVTAGANANGITAKSLGKTSAGDVSLANSATVVTNGAGSNALTATSVVETDTLFASRAMPQLAQASAFEFEAFDFVTFGGGQAGNVSIDHSGNLIARGEGASAIYAQSTGATNGNIDIVVQAESLLVGGSAGGAGVSIIDGAKNSLANHGTITALGDKLGYIPGADGKLFAAGWVDGMAIQGTTGTTDISNSGLVVGIIDMGIGSNRFTNNQDAWIVAGTYIGLGGQSDSLFTNTGVLTSGGIGAVETTVIDGNFDQTETGNYLVDLDFADGGAAGQNMRIAASTPSASGKADRLDVTGQANLGGHLPVNISNTGHAKSGQNDYVIVRAEGGVQDDGMKLEAPDTAVATFTLGYTEHETVLGANIDYAAKGLTENGIAVGNTINDIQFDQTSPAFRPLASAIFAQADIASLQRTYDLIDGEGTAGAQQAYFSDTNAFIGAVSQQTNIWSNPYRQASGQTDQNCTLKNNLCVESLWRGWYSGFGSNTSIKGDPYVVGSGDLKSHSKGMAAGLDYELTKDLLLGFSVGMSKADFKVNDRLTKGDIEIGRTAIYGAYRHNNFYVDGLVGVDWFNASTDRLAAILPAAGNAGFSDRLQNDFSGYGINARLETGYRMDLGGVQVTPFAALQLSSFHMNSSTEYADITGGDLALYYKSRTIHSVRLSLGAQVDTRIDLGDNAHFSPYLRAAWVHEFANKRSVEAGFITAPGYEFVVHGAAQPRNSAQLEAGFNLQIETGLSLYGKVTGSFSGSNHDVSGSGGLRLRW
ncbi:outer membrane autotransporter protein [Paenochrobactrum gallinarii]|uniref:Outer membrane autotransporter protein n=1 Tax=Paenochrobactrum gallinarii TaxID=643673 RepID=A0A841LV23_9HYPH|nr:outer membrane autotransporter protein [Paenochrobactrum gallinarii]